MVKDVKSLCHVLGNIKNALCNKRFGHGIKKKKDRMGRRRRGEGGKGKGGRERGKEKENN